MLPLALTLAALSPTGLGQTDQERGPCWRDVVPRAALPTQPAPVFCSITGRGPGTHVELPNGWFDAFGHGLSFADFLGTSYRVFERVDGIHDSIHWRHADHWMVDVAPLAPTSPWTGTNGGSMLSPARAFRFRAGHFAAEAEFAAGHEDYLGNAAWGEIVVTTADAPSGFRQHGALYGYDLFPGHYTLGIRLQPDRVPVAALMDDSDQSALGGGRLWEMSFFQQVGTTSYGGYPQVTDPEVWRVCDADVDPDTLCRDLFRLELTETSLTLFVNDVKYFEQTGIPSLPAALTQGPIHVYFVSMVSTGAGSDIVRFHWDRLGVNL